ncbi:MAG: hypothetical protein DRN88_02235 [Candidatus Hydrothermarchaeota archaeon]|nr:MAG: hypothetical protein DRN88_02235 [Candidatus Hydrothermarchaeota archaeon]
MKDIQDLQLQREHGIILIKCIYPIKISALNISLRIQEQMEMFYGIMVCILLNYFTMHMRKKIIYIAMVKSGYGNYNVTWKLFKMQNADS